VYKSSSPYIAELTAISNSAKRESPVPGTPNPIPKEHVLIDTAKEFNPEDKSIFEPKSIVETSTSHKQPEIQANTNDRHLQNDLPDVLHNHLPAVNNDCTSPESVIIDEPSSLMESVQFEPVPFVKEPLSILPIVEHIQLAHVQDLPSLISQQDHGKSGDASLDERYKDYTNPTASGSKTVKNTIIEIAHDDDSDEIPEDDDR
jgi:hypothetical protein